MDVMNDKEIGDLWTDYHIMNRPVDNTIRALIRKLVEERAYHGERHNFTAHEQEVFLMDALRDFGIPKDQWK